MLKWARRQIPLWGDEAMLGQWMLVAALLHLNCEDGLWNDARFPIVPAWRACRPPLGHALARGRVDEAKPGFQLRTNSEQNGAFERRFQSPFRAIDPKSGGSVIQFEIGNLNGSLLRSEQAAHQMKQGSLSRSRITEKQHSLPRVALEIWKRQWLPFGPILESYASDVDHESKVRQSTRR